MSFKKWIKQFFNWFLKIFKRGLEAEGVGSDIKIHLDKTNGWHLDIEEHCNKKKPSTNEIKEVKKEAD